MCLPLSLCVYVDVVVCMCVYVVRANYVICIAARELSKSVQFPFVYLCMYIAEIRVYLFVFVVKAIWLCEC